MLPHVARWPTYPSAGFATHDTVHPGQIGTSQGALHFLARYNVAILSAELKATRSERVVGESPKELEPLHLARGEIKEIDTS